MAHQITNNRFMPIVQAPAHEYSALNTVVHRCLDVLRKMGQHYTVITVDQALLCKIMELQWQTTEL